jgi:hypothetical protein
MIGGCGKVGVQILASSLIDKVGLSIFGRENEVNKNTRE